MTQKIKIFSQKFAHFAGFKGVIFLDFGGRKSRFLDFYKVSLELFRKCLGIVFDVKWLLLVVFLAICYTLCYP